MEDQFVSDSTTTRASLLIRLRDEQDAQAWGEFVEIYTPLVYGFLRRRGLQDADAEDVTQDVFRTVARSVGRFDCDRRLGTFRGWLFSVVRSRLSDFRTRRARRLAESGETDVLDHLEEHATEGVWDQDYRRELFDWATRRVRGDFQDSTWQAFWRTGVQGENTKQVAASLNMSEGAVYIAKCRVLARIKQIIQEVEERT
jgi:RNA polymerase sigma-70 factor (ECF subfamily)